MVSLFDNGPAAPCPAPFNMTAYVLDQGLTTPDKTALQIVRPGASIDYSYNDLRQAILGLAQGLLDSGLKQDDKLLIRLGNSVDFPVAYLAAISVGIVPVPTSAQLTQSEVDALCTIISPRGMIYSEDISTPTLHPEITLTQATAQIFYTGPMATPVLGDPNRPAYIVFTSGTSGTPRAVIHAHRVVWARRMMWQDWYALTPDDRIMHAGAFNWTYTMGTGLIDPWTIGATALIPQADTDIADIPALLEQTQATIFAAAPGVYRRLLRTPHMPELPKLRHGLSAGEKLPQALSGLWSQTTGTPLCEAYGMSECSTFISAAPSAPPLLKPQTGRKIAIVDATGTPVPYDTEGTIAVHTTDQGFMLGYDNQPPLELLNGWFLTGDQGRMAQDGHITYLGRSDDMMNAGGYRVSPIEVEACFAALDRIGESAAVSVPIKTDVNVIALFYTGTATPADLEVHAQSQLAPYKRPRVYIARETLPKGANNKLLRKALRTAYLEQHNG